MSKQEKKKKRVCHGQILSHYFSMSLMYVLFLFFHSFCCESCSNNNKYDKKKTWKTYRFNLIMCLYPYKWEILFYYVSNHYQKIDKYKWKYWKNIFLDKFPIDFTDENIPSVYTDGITYGPIERNTDGMKWIILFLHTFSIGKIIFLLLTNSLTDKKVSMKDSPMEHFRR